MTADFLYTVRRQVRLFYHNLPLKFLGEFRILPLFYICGAGLEFIMIHWHVGEVNFYTTYKRRRIEEAVAARLQELETQST